MSKIIIEIGENGVNIKGEYEGRKCESSKLFKNIKNNINKYFKNIEIQKIYENKKEIEHE